MELVDASMSSKPYPPWLGLSTPQSPCELKYAPSIALSSERLSIYIDKDNLHHPSMNVWAPSPSTDLSDDHKSTGMIGTSSQILERIQPVESDSFGSAEEMFNFREEQISTRDYSMRQTYSFLNEMSSSGPQDFPLPWTASKKESISTSSSGTTTSPSDDAWSPPAKVAAVTYTKYSKHCRPQTDDARKAALDKNRAAAAKCRVNKNIETDKLRESEHTAIATNNRLRQEVVDKMEEIQSLHTEVLCHAVDNNCRDPHELREFLCAGEGKVAMQFGPMAMQVDPVTLQEPNLNTKKLATHDL